MCVRARETTDVATSIDRCVATARRVVRTESESRSSIFMMTSFIIRDSFLYLGSYPLILSFSK